MSFVMTPIELTALAIDGSDNLFPVARVFCIGRNYADHAIEMGGNPDREDPFFFAKPATAIVPGGGSLAYPPATANLHHEVELVVAIGAGGRDIHLEAAARCIFGYAVGIDLTRRDLQDEAKKKGRPWDMAKGFDCSGPVGALMPAERAADVGNAGIALDVNGSIRQSGNVNQMIWKTTEAISFLSGLVELRAGDIIFTGTPAGVGAVVRGDRLHAEVTGLPPLACEIV